MEKIFQGIVELFKTKFPVIFYIQQRSKKKKKKRIPSILLSLQNIHLLSSMLLKVYDIGDGSKNL